MGGSGTSGGSNPPKIFRLFLKSEGKEIEKKGCWGGGGYFFTYIFGG